MNGCDQRERTLAYAQGKIRPELIGEFMMGSTEGPDNEKPVHRVMLTRPFLIGMKKALKTTHSARPPAPLA